jgi:hypothetical protein
MKTKKWIISSVFTTGLILSMGGCGSEGGSSTSNSSNSIIKDNYQGTAYLGNLADANVSIYKIDKNGLKTFLWNEKTSSGDSLESIGKFNTHSSDLKDDTLYLYEISKGKDWDFDDDGIKDNNGTENNGTIRALVLGKTVKDMGNQFSVNYLSEYIFNNIEGDIGNIDFDSYQKSLISNLFTDISSSDIKDIYKKVYTFVPYKNQYDLNDTTISSAFKNSIEKGEGIPFGKFINLEMVSSISPKIGKDTVTDVTLKLNSSLEFHNVPIFIQLEDGITLGTAYIDNITPSKHYYNIEIPVTSEENITNGTHKFIISLNGDFEKNISSDEFEITSDSSAIIGDVASTDTETDENNTILGRVLGKTTKPKIDATYNDGNMTINAIIDIKNPFVDKNISNVVLKAFTTIGDSKIPVPISKISSDKNITDTNSSLYAKDITIPLIYPASTKHLSLEMFMTKEDINNLFLKIIDKMKKTGSSISDFNVLLDLSTQSGTTISQYNFAVTNLFLKSSLKIFEDNAEKLTKGEITIEELLNLINNVEKTAGRILYKKDDLASAKKELSYSKEFKSYHYKSKFGVGFYAKGRASIDSEGIHTKTYGKLKVKVLEFDKFEMFKLNFIADADPASFENTGYDVSLDILGATVYSSSNSLRQVTDTSIKKGASKDEKRKLAQEKLAYMKESDESIFVGFKKNRKFSAENGYAQTLFIGPIPLYISAGADATVGVKAGIGLTGVTTLEGFVTPYLEVSAYASAGLGAGFKIFKDFGVEYSAGIKGNLTLMSDEFKNSVIGKISLEGNDEYFTKIVASLEEDINNTFKGPNGNLKRYISYYGPSKYRIDCILHQKKCYIRKNCIKNPFTGNYINDKKKQKLGWTWLGSCWGQKYYDRIIADWSSGIEKTTVLLHKKQDLYEIPLATIFDVKWIDNFSKEAVAKSMATVPTSKKVLFAHGLNANKKTWDTYADYAESEEWEVYRTDVKPTGSIAERAKQLAEYINSLELDDNSLIAVGHSMGGLDLHYIVSKGHSKEEPFYSAAKKISKIYTIATPHKGADFSGALSEEGDAYDDLSRKSMFEFNKEYPYTTFSVDGRKIPLLAIRFTCGTFESFGTDGVVNIKYQSLDGAPFSAEIFKNSHTEENPLCKDVKSELENTGILGKILNNGIKADDPNKFLTTHRDIVFYDKYKCEGNEVGSFNSNYPVDIDCSDSIGCENNDAKSVKIYPYPENDKNISIYVYDLPKGYSSKYDYARIDINDMNLTEPVCITNFDHSKTINTHISVKFHNNNSEKKLSGNVSHIKIKQK